MKKFPKIGQYRDALYNLKHAGFEGTVNYLGRVKLHGTNAAIVVENGKISCQSRNQIITPLNDNIGFAKWVSELPKQAIGSIARLAKDCDFVAKRDYVDKTILYGEWCGNGIQSGVGINQVKGRVFVIFAICVVERSKLIQREGDEEFFLTSHWIISTDWNMQANLNEHGIYHIGQFPSFKVIVDTARPHMAQNMMARLTEMVEANCPVAEVLANIPKGQANVGEGIVWIPERYALEQNHDFWFKTKGEKHSASKVRTIAEVDLVLAKNLEEFIDNTVTEVRLNQALDYLDEMGIPRSVASTGKFISWVHGDILAEETDTLEASGLEPKQIGKPVAIKAKDWFFERLRQAA